MASGIKLGLTSFVSLAGKDCCGLMAGGARIGARHFWRDRRRCMSAEVLTALTGGSFRWGVFVQAWDISLKRRVFGHAIYERATKEGGPSFWGIAPGVVRLNWIGCCMRCGSWCGRREAAMRGVAGASAAGGLITADFGRLGLGEMRN